VPKLHTNSLFVKVFAAFWLLILLLSTVLILLPALDGRQLQSVTKNDRLQLKKQSEYIHHFIDQYPDVDASTFVNVIYKQRAREIYLTDLSGRLINDKAPRRVRQFILDSQFSNIPLKEVHKRRIYLGPTLINYQHRELFLYISFPNQGRSLVLIQWLIENPLLLLITALLISTPICAFLAWNLTKPLRQLRNVANKVAQGQLDTPFPVIKNTNEIDQLAKSMQLMVNSLKNMLSAQQRLLGDISHELRTPLTRLRLALAINKKRSGDNNELQRIELETVRIEAMISELLNLSRVQLSLEQKECLALNKFLDELLLDACFEAEQNGKKFIYPTLSSDPIHVYPELAYRAIENIIRNAIKYAANQITVEVSIQSNDITLTIKNDGPLIPEDELANIFRPFYRLHESRDRESGGVGLGLSIAENAMFKHSGKIWAENIDNQVCMHLQFPQFS